MEDNLRLLLENINNSIKSTIKDKKIGVAFSGGVDSSLIAKLCSEQGFDITLLTIGFANSPDIFFAEEVNQFLKLPHQIYEIEEQNFNTISQAIHQKIKTDNLSWNENCIAFYYVSKLAQSLGLKTVVTANGIDELFCGYNAYRDAIEESEKKVMNLMDSKIENELKMMKEVNTVASEFNVSIIQPILSLDFREYAKTIPISEKIKGSDDLLRKHIIRNLASKIGIPEFCANKRKKALQYGSLIHKALIKSRKTF